MRCSSTRVTGRINSLANILRGGRVEEKADDDEAAKTR